MTAPGYPLPFDLSTGYPKAEKESDRIKWESWNKHSRVQSFERLALTTPAEHFQRDVTTRQILFEPLRNPKRRKLIAKKVLGLA
jgi:hypothetical protein